MQASLSTSHPRSLSIEELKNLIRQSLKNGLTGRIHVIFQREKTLTLFATHGVVSQLYIRNHRVPDTNWELLLAEYGRGTLEIEEMHPRGLMFRKIVLERLERTIHQASGTNQLKTMFDLAELNTFPSLFHIHWESAEGFVLVAGRDNPLRHAVMKTKDEELEGFIALDQITGWKEARCNVAVYRGNIQSEAWLEIYLNILLELFCSKILNQYEQLTGKVMVRSILWKIQTMAVQSGWTLDIQENAVRDTTIFPTARDTGDAYKKVIAETINHVEPIIGASLTQNILTQSIDSTRGVYKIIAEVFNLLGEPLL